MRGLLTALLGASLLLGACGDDDDNGDRAAVTSIPDETTASSTTTASEPRTVAPDVIPQDERQITEEYVEQVLDELYVVSLEAAKLARQENLVGTASIQLIEATSTQHSAIDRINGLSEDARNGFAGYQEDPRPVDVTVVEVLVGGPECIFAEAQFDTSGLMSDPGNADEFRIFARLLPAAEEQLATGLNPTAWVLDDLPATNDGSVPDETCAKT